MPYNSEKHKQIISYLKQAFPKSENKWKTIVLVSVFISVFLVVFKPFGIRFAGNNSKSLFILGGYGLVTLIILIIDLVLIERIFSRFFKEANWTLGKEILWLFAVIFSIGIGNLFYTSFFFDELPFTLSNILNFQMITLAVAFFPLTLYVIAKYKYLSKKYAAIADEVNNILGKESQGGVNNDIITFYSYNNKDSMNFDSEDFCFLESKGNYINLHLLVENELRQFIFRNTLKNSSLYFKDYPNIVQCHRAYLVNANKIISAKGNSQGLRLKLVDCDMEIPVSKNFVTSIKSIL